ncbi:unnamed protein product [Brassica oleracea]
MGQSCRQAHRKKNQPRLVRYAHKKHGGASTHIDQVLIRLLFQVVVYHVWWERNLRKHQQGHKGTYHMIIMNNKVVKNRISSLGYKANHRLERLLRRWFEVFE